MSESPTPRAGLFGKHVLCKLKRPVLGVYSEYTPRLAFLLGYATASRWVPDPSQAVFLPVSGRGSPNFHFELKKFLPEKLRFFPKFSKFRPSAGVLYLGTGDRF